jgi:hypothetical protein
VDYISCSNRHNPPSPHRRKKKEILEGFTLRIGNNLSIHWPPLLLFYFEKKKKNRLVTSFFFRHTHFHRTRAYKPKTETTHQISCKKETKKHGEEEEMSFSTI